MTYVLNLEPEVARRVEQKAKTNGLAPEQWLETLAQSATKESVSEAELEAAMHRVFDRYEKTFEILAEGAK